MPIDVRDADDSLEVAAVNGRGVSGRFSGRVVRTLRTAFGTV